MLKLFSLIETRQIQAKIIAGFRVFAIFAFPSLVRSMRFEQRSLITLYYVTQLRGCVADVVYFSSPHQRSGSGCLT